MHPEAKALLERLALAPHPEGGFYRETFRSPRFVRADGAPSRRSASTAIYFLLPAGHFSALHRVSSDEAWHFYDGDPLMLTELTEAGALTQIILGRDIAKGEVPQHVVSGGVLQAATPVGDRFSLVGCTVAPGFDFDDFAMPSRAELTHRYPEHAAAIVKLTR